MIRSSSNGQKLETKMDRIKRNDKETEIFKETEESWGLIFLLQDWGELSISFFSCFKMVGTNYRSSDQHLLNWWQYLGEYLKIAC